MKRFNSKALYEALNQQRLAHRLTWRELADQIGDSMTTITRLKNGGRMEVDGMLAMVDWLRVPVETFVRDSPD
jgi:transcriptional regulator with XRE-family HTH domain